MIARMKTNPLGQKYMVNILKFLKNSLVGFQGWNSRNACQDSKHRVGTGLKST